MSDPQPQPEPVPVIEFICSECGELVGIRDPIAFIRALHLANECTVSGLVVHGP